MKLSGMIAAVAAGVLVTACDAAKPVAEARAAGAPEAAAAPSRDEIVAQGKYIVEAVGMCADCHTPRGSDGQLDAGKSLWGAPLDFAPTSPLIPFKNLSPALAGLPQGCSEDQLANFLQNGNACDGTPPLPPMPAYRMKESDAKAVAAYLSSLPKPT